MPSPDDSPWQRAASGGSGDQGPADLASASASGSDGLRDDASWLNQWYDSKPMAEEGASSRSSGSNRLSDDAIKSLKAEIKFLAERELKALEEEEAHLRHAKYGFLKKYHDFKKGSMTARETLKNDFAISELQTKLIDLRVAIRDIKARIESKRETIKREMLLRKGEQEEAKLLEQHSNSSSSISDNVVFEVFVPELEMLLLPSMVHLGQLGHRYLM